VRLCRLFRKHAVEAWGERAEYWWRTSWFPITERLGAIRCDCAVDEGAPTPIYYADSHDDDAGGLTTPRVDSFGTMVSWWIQALESGAWRYVSARAQRPRLRRGGGRGSQLTRCSSTCTRRTSPRISSSRTSVPVRMGRGQRVT
jgi:hypothetical protein